jgi:hypothetical protein
MDRTSTINGSEKFSENTENELIKLAGLLNGEEWEAVRYYLGSLQTDVNDEVIRRIVNYSKNYKGMKIAHEKVNY